jgi:hypothetical protein
MGDNQITTTSGTSPSNPKVTETINKLLGGVQEEWGKGPAVFNESLYGGVGDNTRRGWQSAMDAANNPAFGAGISNATNYANTMIGQGGLTDGARSDLATTRGVGAEYGRMADSQRQPGLYESTMMGTARGDNLNGKDPFFQSNLARTLDEAGAGVSAAVGAGGRFGSGAHVGALGKTLGGISDTARSNEYNRSLERQQQALQGIGGERQTRFGNEFTARGAQAGQAGAAFGMEQQGVNNTMGAASALPDLFRASLLPGQTMGAVGAAQDADRQAALMGRHDLFRRQNDAKTDLLGRLSSILGVNAGAAGSTTTETQPGTPWWQSALGLAGQFI